MCTQGIGLLLDPVIGTLNQGNILRGIFSHKVKSDENDIHCGSIFTPQPLRAPGYCRTPSGRAGGRAGGRADKPR